MYIIENIKQNFQYQIDNFNMKDIQELCDMMISCNNIYITGIGKSESIVMHFVSLLKSISLNVFVLNCTNSLHGDIGCIKHNDVVCLFSNSGNTIELCNIIPYLNTRCMTIGITCNKMSRFKDLCQKLILLPFQGEINSNISNIPTNSCMSQLLFCNIVVSKLSDNISVSEYKKNHPAGNIGKNLLNIADEMIYKYPKIILEKNIRLHIILLEMTKYKIGCCFFVDDEDILLGILTDGDMRRLILQNSNIDTISVEDINTEYYYESDLDKKMTDIRNEGYIPILREQKILGIIKKNS